MVVDNAESSVQKMPQNGFRVVMEKPPGPIAAETAAHIRENYAAIWPPILHPWTDYLIACRKAFDGDLDAMLILAAIGTMTLKGFESGSADARTISYDDMLAADYAGPAARAINAESIAAFISIPKETVRRKVNGLIKRGWVARGDKGTLRATRQSASDLNQLSGATFELISIISLALGRPKEE
jgi:hypothetical protein